MSSVLVVGAGISGAACATALRSAGVQVDVAERGRAPGGRLASPSLHGRRVDLGAAYVSASDDEFVAVVEDWHARGLMRPWTETFDVYEPDGHRTTSGPMRWAAPGGLRTLARDLHGQVVLSENVSVLSSDHDVTVLAMPDPQAAQIVGDAIEWVDYDPVIAVAAGWGERSWPIDHAAFVNDDPDLAFVADDGARRGDHAPVLVAHSSAALAREHLDDPDGAVAPVLAALRRVLGINEPQWTHAHRWTFAKPTGTHGDAQYFLDGSLGVCGDSWCPSGAPRVESAWLSGHRLGTALAARLS